MKVQDSCGEDMNRLSRLMFLGFTRGVPKPMRRLIIFQTVATVLCLFVWIRFNGGLVPWFLSPTSVNGAAASDSHLWEYFPEARDDGSVVTWAHAVNSRSALEQTMKGHYMVIEGDIELRGQNTDHQQLVAVMAAPPGADADLTFDEWFEMVRTTNAGLKLDFKTIEAVEISLQRLRDIQPPLRVPVQLSADVLMGPESLLSPSRPLNPTRFLRLCATHFGRATVAVGWSGGGATGSDAAYYDWWAVKRMHDALTSTEEGGAVPTRVAINVRARWARASLGPLRWLTQMTDASLTLLAEPGESVTVADLLWVRARLPWRRVHYDIGGGALRERFNALKNDVAPVSDRQFDADQWKVAATPAAAQHVYLGTHAVLMRRALLVSRRPAVGGLAGRVHFLQASTAAVLTVLVRVTQAGRPDSLSAVSCAIAGDGGVRVASQSIPGVDRALEARLPASATDRPACLEFVIADTGHNITLTVTRPASCADGHDGGGDDGKGSKPAHVTVHFPMAGIQTDGRHLALRTDMDVGFIAVDRLVATFSDSL